jgi:hypothetical protein
MTVDEYLSAVLVSCRAQTGRLGPGLAVRDGLLPVVRAWAGTQLLDLRLSGSYAKATAIVGGTDVDLFCSLRSNTTQTLKQLYDSLAVQLGISGYAVRRQNVSLGITFGGLKVDITPGKQQTPSTTDHSIYVRRLDSWRQTNVDMHISLVKSSGLVDVILLVKRWRQVHNLEFLSFALELAVIRSLGASRYYTLGNALMAVFRFLTNNIRTCQLLDPANSNNNLMDEFSDREKSAIAALAAQATTATTWRQILW